MSGHMNLVYKDQQAYDNIPYETDGIVRAEDGCEFAAEFTDPDGNEYAIDEIKHVIEVPIFPWKTDGGVRTFGHAHGNTGTGNPLQATLFAYAYTFWGVCDLRVNDELTDQNEDRLIHLRTTQMDRDSDYNLHIEGELPVADEKKYLGQDYHTNVGLPPLKHGADGVEAEPIDCPYGQEGIHIIWDEDIIEDISFESPF